MAKIIYILCMSLGSGLGWYLGSKVGGLMTSYFVSVVGAAFGMYYGRKISSNHMP